MSVCDIGNQRLPQGGTGASGGDIGSPGPRGRSLFVRQGSFEIANCSVLLAGMTHGGCPCAGSETKGREHFWGVCSVCVWGGSPPTLLSSPGGGACQAKMKGPMPGSGVRRGGGGGIFFSCFSLLREFSKHFEWTHSFRFYQKKIFRRLQRLNHNFHLHTDHIIVRSTKGRAGAPCVTFSFDVKLDDLTLTKNPELLVHQASIRICGLPHVARREHKNKTGCVLFHLVRQTSFGLN